MLLTQLETPALVLDEEVFENNLSAMNKLLDGKKLKLRPHYKSNKCPAIAKRQISMGAVGITCAKFSEAEDLADCGIEDILIANQIVDIPRIRRVAELAGRCHLTVCVDSRDNAATLSREAMAAGTTIYCYVEYEIGMQRCGVEDEDEYIALAEYIRALPGLEYSGIQAYAGHVSHMVTEEERLQYSKASGEKIRKLIRELEKRGFTDIAVSGGSTGTSVIKADDGLYTELQAGSYIFLDATYRELENIPFRNSLYVLSTVVSVSEGRVMLDAGVKSIGVDQGLPAVFTLSMEQISCRESEANEEHIKLFDPSVKLKAGDKVLLIPGHCCSTINLYNKLYTVRNDKVTDRFLITARGCSR